MAGDPITREVLGGDVAPLERRVLTNPSNAQLDGVEVGQVISLGRGRRQYELVDKGGDVGKIWEKKAYAGPRPGEANLDRIARGERIATEELDVGICVVNDFVKSDVRLPFGGVKGSGYGRELADVGIKEFVNIKTVCIS